MMTGWTGGHGDCELFLLDGSPDRPVLMQVREPMRDHLRDTPSARAAPVSAGQFPLALWAHS